MPAPSAADVRAEIERRQINQAHVAAETGVNPSNLSRWMNGKLDKGTGVYESTMDALRAWLAKRKPGPKKGRTCSRCGSADHDVRTCDVDPNSRKCSVCGKLGHDKRNCPSVRAADSDEDSEHGDDSEGLSEMSEDDTDGEGSDGQLGGRGRGCAHGYVHGYVRGCVLGCVCLCRCVRLAPNRRESWSIRYASLHGERDLSEGNFLSIF